MYSFGVSPRGGGRNAHFLSCKTSPVLHCVVPLLASVPDLSEENDSNGSALPLESPALVSQPLAIFCFTGTLSTQMHTISDHILMIVTQK